MQWLINSLLILAICEPLFLDAKKVVVVMPRLHRRSHSTPWRHLRHIKKNGFPTGFNSGPKYGFSRGPHLYRPKEIPRGKDQYPSGGDDFDQGHEEVNHVMVPHGKGITHAVSFGKGYIPFDTYKDHRPSASFHHDYDEERPTGHASIRRPHRPIYYPAVLSQQISSHVEDEDSDDDDELQDRVQDRAAQNNVDANPSHDDVNAHLVEMHFGPRSTIGKSSVLGASGSSPTTNAVGKGGIVLRDSIVFDDYNRQVQELTKKWPASFATGNHIVPGSDHRYGIVHQQHRHFLGSGFSGGNNFPSNLGMYQRGYEVKEDVVDVPHDFRTTPIRTTPPELPQPPQSHIQYIRQPLPQTVQHIFTQLPIGSQIPSNYGISNGFGGLLHG